MDWESMKWLLRCFKYIVNDGFLYKSSNDGVELIVFMDSNFASVRDKRISISLLMLTLCGNYIS